jgi:PAS domain S-box-containing protein
VFNLYVTEGHDRKPEEELFLSSVASILATTIEKKQAEEALRKSEERFYLAVRGTDAGIWDWDLETNSVYFSPRWKSMLGYNEEEISNDFSQWENRLHPEDRAIAAETIDNYLQGKTAVYELEHRLQHKDGSYRWILSRGAVVRDQQGKPYRMVGSHIDITKRKDAEDALSKREAQLRLAQSIQEHLLPAKPPVLPGFDIAGALYPAEFAAGDHYDYLDMSDGSLGVVIGDVSGKGIGPAMLMATLCARLRSFAMTDFEIDEILTRTNLALTNEVEESLFITAILARLDTTSRTLTYVNAGHPPGYVIDRSGDVKALMESTGIPLGILPDAEFPIGPSIELEQGDTVILFTDGAFEARSSGDDFFGMDRVIEVVRQNRDESASDVIRLVRQAVCEFSGGDHSLDDFTMVLIKG